MKKLRDAVDQLLLIGATVLFAETNVAGLDFECSKKGGERAFTAGIAVLFSKRIELTMDAPGERDIWLSETADDHSTELVKVPYGELPMTSDGLGAWLYRTKLPSWKLAHIEALVALDNEKSRGNMERAGGDAKAKADEVVVDNAPDGSPFLGSNPEQRKGGWRQ